MTADDMTLLEQRAATLLRSAGMEPDGRDIQNAMASWLGTNPVCEGLTVEDCQPLPPSVYTTALQLFSSAWRNHHEMGSTHAWTKNPFLESILSPETISLEAVFPSILATKWMVAWMELSKNDTTENELICQLFSHDTVQHDLVHSLYQHVRELPVLQAHFHRYTQSLRQNNHNSTTLPDPTLRLQQYELAQTVSHKFETEWNQHIDRLEVVLTAVYTSGDVAVRKLCRRLLAAVWHDFLKQQHQTSLRHENTRAAGIRLTVRLLYSILQGIPTKTQQPLPGVYRQLLLQYLVPLHEPNALVLWRDQMSILELYHEPLTQCIGILLQREPSWTEPCLMGLMEIFPKVGNTPKQVLLLHEVDIYIQLMSNLDNSVLKQTGCNRWWPVVLSTVARCMASDHSRVSERAMSFFKNKMFEQLVRDDLEATLPVLLRALVKREVPWNPTVRRHAYHILQDLQQYDSNIFARVCNKEYDHIGGSTATSAKSTGPSQSMASASSLAEQPSSASPFSLRSGMGKWTAPSIARGTNTPQKLSSSSSSSQHQPPLTITGVAPWAQSSVTQHVSRNRPSRRLTPQAGMRLPTIPSGPPSTHTGQKRPIEKDRSSTIDEKQDISTSPQSGIDYVAAFMKKIKPPEDDTGFSSWSRTQLAETPTLLPNLKFHDLVFGHELGTGAFSVVKYARLIDRKTSRSKWAEYAVKIISTARIQEMNYEASVQREIAVLTMLSHPGVARLVSSFRFHDGAYLVLEYASRGDLHTLVRTQGSLDEASTRFVIGEIAATLGYIHSSGFVYGDLKPENVVITETGHLKLTDFGGCRPITAETKANVASAAKNLLQNLRSGDWRKSPGNSELKEALGEESPNNDVGEADDYRVEGTTAYLPPEVVMGAIPTPAADSWALGCVLFQCLSGRPPMLDVDDHATRKRIVSFRNDSSPGTNNVNNLFTDSHSSQIGKSAQQLIMSLLCNVPEERMSIQDLPLSDFFKDEDIASLYQRPAHQLDAGHVAPVADARWARRQLSTIWSPQPSAYNMELATDAASERRGNIRVNAPILEGEERAGAFLPLVTSGIPAAAIPREARGKEG